MAALRLFARTSFKFPKLTRSTKQDSKKELPADKETHTGQKWDSDDYRMVRYINSDKHVNPNIALELINAVKPEAKKERVVWCDGESGVTPGHPRVYINLDKPGNHACSYCGLRFYKKDDDH